MDRLNPWRTGSAIALTVAVVSVVCAAAVYLFPEGPVDFVNSWTHSLYLTVLRSEKTWTLGSLAFGLLLSPIFVGAAMALSSVSVATNALRLNRVRL